MTLATAIALIANPVTAENPEETRSTIIGEYPITEDGCKTFAKDLLEYRQKSDSYYSDTYEHEIETYWHDGACVTFSVSKGIPESSKYIDINCGDSYWNCDEVLRASHAAY